MALALDGHNGKNASTANVTVSLTTANANDIIYLFASGNLNSGINFGSDTSGLSWTIRSSNPFGAAGSGVVTAWAVAASAGTFSITVTNAFGAVNATYQVWGISGANTASPFDGSIVQNTTANTSPSITTANAADFIMGGYNNTSGNVTLANGFAFLDTTNYGASSYLITSTTFSGSLGSTGTWTTSWADAIKQASGGGGAASGGTLSMMGIGHHKHIGWTPLMDRRAKVRYHRRLWRLDP